MLDAIVGLWCIRGASGCGHAAFSLVDNAHPPFVVAPGVRFGVVMNPEVAERLSGLHPLSQANAFVPRAIDPAGTALSAASGHKLVWRAATAYR